MLNLFIYYIPINFCLSTYIYKSQPFYHCYDVENIFYIIFFTVNYIHPIIQSIYLDHSSLYLKNYKTYEPEIWNSGSYNALDVQYERIF